MPKRNDLLLAAVQSGDVAAARICLEREESPDGRAPSGLTLLMIAAGRADAAMARLLLEAGADVFALDTRGGATALHKACLGGSFEVARMLLDAGAFVDVQSATTGHTPLIEALWYKRPEIVKLLLERGAGLNINTHYGFTLEEHLQYALKVNTIGGELLVKSEEYVQQRLAADQELVRGQTLISAVARGDLEAVRKLLADGVPVDERAPILNGFNDGHTPLLVASRDGHTEIVAALLQAGADVNAVEPTFGAVPLHKAVYNGHADITQLLVRQSAVDLDFQGVTNGYTPLHDSIWHGFGECALILITAGARLDLAGHDGNTPLDLATEVFGPDDEVTVAVRERLK